MVDLGLPLENIWVTDIEGVVYEGRWPDRFAQKTDARKLAEVIEGRTCSWGCRPGRARRRWWRRWVPGR